MACVNCNKIRAAILHGKMAEAAGLTIGALREKLGLTAMGEVPVDAESLPPLASKNKAELLAIAADEGVEIEVGATNAEIVAAIDRHRVLVTA